MTKVTLGRVNNYKGNEKISYKRNVKTGMKLFLHSIPPLLLDIQLVPQLFRISTKYGSKKLIIHICSTLFVFFTEGITQPLCCHENNELLRNNRITLSINRGNLSLLIFLNLRLLKSSVFYKRNKYFLF